MEHCSYTGLKTLSSWLSHYYAKPSRLLIQTVPFDATSGTEIQHLTFYLQNIADATILIYISIIHAKNRMLSQNKFWFILMTDIANICKSKFL